MPSVYHATPQSPAAFALHLGVTPRTFLALVAAFPDATFHDLAALRAAPTFPATFPPSSLSLDAAIASLPPHHYVARLDQTPSLPGFRAALWTPSPGSLNSHRTSPTVAGQSPADAILAAIDLLIDMTCSRSLSDFYSIAPAGYISPAERVRTTSALGAIRARLLPAAPAPDARPIRRI